MKTGMTLKFFILQQIILRMRIGICIYKAVRGLAIFLTFGHLELLYAYNMVCSYIKINV